jgi:ribulose-phosphate 3-epimerase
MQIIPAILEKDFDKVEIKVDRLRRLLRWVQIDISDNVFVEGKTFELELLNKLEHGEEYLWDMHLMVNNPIKWIEKCIFVGAGRITGQVEMMEDKQKFIDTVKDAGIEAGLAYDIETEIDTVPEETNVVLLMGRKAGFVPMEMDERVYEKISKLKKYKEESGRRFLIGIDGGVNTENIERLAAAGVEIFYVTAAVFNGDIVENIKNLEENGNRS